MAFGLGPRATRVYASLRRSIAGGELPPGTKLPAHTALAQQYGVAPLTMRQVLAQLEARGLVSREQGRGTFVRARTAAAVLLLAGDEEVRERRLRGRRRTYYPARRGPGAGPAGA